jgi:hypothetical protein
VGSRHPRTLPGHSFCDMRYPVRIEAACRWGYEVRESQPLNMQTIKYWEIIAGNLNDAGYSWGYCHAVTRKGWRFIVDAYCGDGRGFIVESDELLTAFLELEATVL